MSARPTPQALPEEPQSNGCSPPIDLSIKAVRELAAVAAQVCDAPFACISHAEGDITWSRPAANPQTFHHQRFSEMARRSSGLVEVEDVGADRRYSPAAGFYAGVALAAADGEVMGTLVVMDSVPRKLSDLQRRSLLALASSAAAQLALCARLNFVRAVGDSAPVAIYRTDAQGNLNYVNPAYRKVFGLARDQQVNDWPIHVHPDDRAQLQADCSDFYRHPRAMHLAYRTMPPGGELRHFTEHCVPIEGASGFVGTITDVTELVAARNELHKTETLFQNTCEQAPIGIVYADYHGRLLRCNQAFTRLLGFRTDELEHWTLRDLTYGEDRANVEDKLERLWRGDLESVDLEKRFRRKDGTVLWVRTSTALVREGVARPECSVEFVRDITVRKTMEDTLLQNQTLLEAVVTNLPVAVLTSDATGNITRYNRGAEELFSIPAASEKAPGGLRGYPLTSDVFLIDGITPLEPAKRPLARALRGETITDLELVVVPHGSPPRTTVTNACRLVDTDGRTLGAVSVIRDITERRRAEHELERAHQQLIDASRKAGMAEIATNVLHNVGNVLNSVNVSANLLSDRIKQSKTAGLGQVAALLKDHGANLAAFISSDERGRQLPLYLASLGEQLQADKRVALDELESLRRNIDHIKHIVNMQQNYAKNGDGEEAISVSALIDDCVRMNIGALTREGVTVLREVEALPPIKVDRHKVLQILVNLVRNAKNACDESGRTDKILTIRVTCNEERVRFSVIDNGAGIAEENMPRLFTHGFTTRPTGHGFGLHSSALTARELGGSLSAYSEGPGQGARFVLELPRGASSA
jgi:PAS domain S-box-containing protein